MTENSTILDVWPGIKTDLLEFLTDTDAWAIKNLEAAHKSNNREKLSKIIDIMDSLHGLSHLHEH